VSAPGGLVVVDVVGSAVGNAVLDVLDVEVLDVLVVLDVVVVGSSVGSNVGYSVVVVLEVVELVLLVVLDVLDVLEVLEVLVSAPGGLVVVVVVGSAVGSRVGSAVGSAVVGSLIGSSVVAGEDESRSQMQTLVGEQLCPEVKSALKYAAAVDGM